MARWICPYCATTGDVPPGLTAEELNCPECGEPVTPDPARSR